MIYKQLYNKIKPAMEDTSAVGMVVRLSYIFDLMMSSLEKSFFTEHFGKMPKEYHDLRNMCDSLIEVVKLVESGITGTGTLTRGKNSAHQPHF